MGQTMAISRDAFNKIKTITQDAIQNLNVANKNSSEKDQVYHIEIAAFPLTRRLGDKK